MIFLRLITHFIDCKENPEKINNEYKNRFMGGGAMDRNRYKKRMVEVLNQPVTMDNDSLIRENELFNDKNTASAISDPFKPLIVTHKAVENDILHFLKHEN